MAEPLHHVRPLRTGLPGVQALVTESARSFGRHTHDQFGIGLVVQGAHASHSCAGRVEAQPGDCITVHPGEVHDGSPLGGMPRRWFMLYLDSTAVDGAYEFARPVLRNPALRETLLALHGALAGGMADGLLVEQESARLLALAAGRPPGQIEVPAVLRRARQLIDDCPSSELTLDALARAAGMDKFQLVRGFGHAFGLTPHACLMQRRIQLARALLAAGVPVVQAAADAGFADQSHLTRLFARTFGITPAAYRRAFA
ncbi:AraC family transcriptional regulator [Massilia sp. METH4]|uniref:helix-turn-helix transcriptional regulator n=1 Tax=Massilia sp. METH4 TaxID=3123041 RepID=UPI0030D5FD9D